MRRELPVPHLGCRGAAGLLALLAAAGCGAPPETMPRNRAPIAQARAGVVAKDPARRELDTATVRQALENVFHGYRSRVIRVEASGEELRITTTIDPGVDRTRPLSRVYCEAINAEALRRDRVRTVRILGRRRSNLREC